MSKRHFEKKDKYNQLAIDLRNPRRVGGAWTVYPFEVEVGARGAINEQPWSYMCSKLGFTSAARQQLKWAVQDAAQNCSHLIFLRRFHKNGSLNLCLIPTDGLKTLNNHFLNP